MMSYLDKRLKTDLLQDTIGLAGDLDAVIKKKINYKFRLDWNYYSNNMEGNTLTKEETRSVMVKNITVHGKPIKDILEIKGHDEVISDILQIGKGNLRMSETRIKQIHSAIMHEDNPLQKNKIGEWKVEPNYIYNYQNERFDFTAPEDVPTAIHDLLNRTNAAIDAVLDQRKNAPHPIDVALNFHVEYLTIHPFYDGNGRTARILTNLLLISFGYPPFWMTTKERDAYYQYIGDIQCYGGKPDLFFEFACDKIQRSQQLVLDAIAGKDISSEEDWDKEIAMLQKMQELKPKPVTKSQAVIHETLNEVYFPLLLELNTYLVKLSALFRGNTWMYYTEPKPKENIQITPVFASLQEVTNYLNGIVPLNDSFHHYKAAFWLNHYNSAKDFSIEVSFRVFFEKEEYRIEVFIGKPGSGDQFSRTIRELLDTPENFGAYKEYTLLQEAYKTPLSSAHLQELVKQISQEVLEYIKYKVEERIKD